MTLAQSFLAELQHEANNTRKLLDVITNDILDFKPFEGGWSVGELASHIAETYNWYPYTILQDSIDFATYEYDKGDITKTTTILEKFEENLKAAESALAGIEDDAMLGVEYKLFVAGNPAGSMPRAAAVRSMLMNHLYHHRGQLTTYLRCAGKKIPGIYGPSKDEQ